MKKNNCLKGIILNHYMNTFINKIMIIGISIISSSLLARYLGPENRGKYSYILSMVNIMFLFLNLGVCQSYNYYKKNKKNKKVENLFFSISLYLSLVYFIIFTLITLLLKNNQIFYIGIFTSLMILEKQLEMIGIVENIIKVNKIILIITVLNLLIYLFLIFAIKRFELKIVFFVLIFNYTIKIFFYYKFFFILKFEKINLKLIKEILMFSFFPMLTNLMITLNYRVDIFMIKKFLNYELLGIYTVGVGLAEMVWIIPDSFKQVLFSKTVKNKDSKLDIIFSIKINLIIMLVLNIFILLFGQYLIVILYGKKFIESYSVTKIIFIGLIPMVFFKMINTLYISEGNQKYTFKVLLLAVLTNVLLNYLFIPKYSIQGAALASVFSYSFTGVIFLINFFKRYQINIRDLIYSEKK